MDSVQTRRDSWPTSLAQPWWPYLMAAFALALPFRLALPLRFFRFKKFTPSQCLTNRPDELRSIAIEHAAVGEPAALYQEALELGPDLGRTRFAHLKSSPFWFHNRRRIAEVNETAGIARAHQRIVDQDQQRDQDDGEDDHPHDLGNGLRGETGDQSDRHVE